MKKTWKRLAIVTAVGAAIGLVIAYFSKNRCEEEVTYDFDDNEDFDLDSDLQPVERGYVSLNKSDDASAKDVEETDTTTEEAPAESEKEKEEAPVEEETNETPAKEESLN